MKTPREIAEEITETWWQNPTRIGKMLEVAIAQAIEAERERARIAVEALKKYANKENWFSKSIRGRDQHVFTRTDLDGNLVCGRTARDALAKIGEMK